MKIQTKFYTNNITLLGKLLKHIWNFCRIMATSGIIFYTMDYIWNVYILNSIKLFWYLLYLNKIKWNMEHESSKLILVLLSDISHFKAPNYHKAEKSVHSYTPNNRAWRYIIVHYLCFETVLIVWIYSSDNSRIWCLVNNTSFRSSGWKIGLPQQF